MKFAIIGAPNSGKSVLFNFLTGLHQKVANYPGCTVSKKTGILKFNKEHSCIDLPGIYSLNHHSKDASIATDYVLSYKKKDIDEFLVVCNSTALHRSLILVMQLKKLNIPITVILNMKDELLQRGGKIDVEYLQKTLQVPVFFISATKKWKTMDIVHHIREKIKNYTNKRTQITKTDTEVLQTYPPLDSVSEEVKEISNRAVLKLAHSHKLSERLDSVLLHPIFGLSILIFISLLIFQTVFTWITPIMDAISFFFEGTANILSVTLPDLWIFNLLTEGAITGLGSVLVFLPQIIILTFAIGLMEMTGYMSRATFIMDALLSKLGLQGKVFMPLLTSHACAIPGIMATRTIGNPLDRLLTIFAAPFMSCSARLPVYTLLITAFIPNHVFLGFISIRTLILFGLYFCGSAVGIIITSVYKFFYQNKHDANTIIDRIAEIPSYHIPTIKSLYFYIWNRVKMFLKRAGGIILVISIVFWILSNTYIPNKEKVIENSYIVTLGKAIQPLFAPMGLDWQSSTAVLIGLTAREVFISASAVLYKADDESKPFITTIQNKLNRASGLALLIYFIYAPQCLATFAVMFRETQSRKFTALSFASMFIIAYLLASLTYVLFS